MKHVMKLILMLVFSLSLCASPSKSAPTKSPIQPTILTKERVYALMDSLHANTLPYSCRDERYMLPTVNFVKHTFAKALAGYNHGMGTYQYERDAYDCDDFSEGARHFMVFLHKHSPARIPNTGIAFGVFDYIRRDNIHHSINFALINQEGQIKVLFFEPETYSILELTEDEIQSCTRWFM